MKEMSRVSRVSLNALTNYTRFFITMIIALIIIPFIINALGQAQYGLWTLTFSIIGFFELLDFGFGLGVVKWTGETRASKDYEFRNNILSTVFFLYITIAVVGMLIIGIFSLFYPKLFSIPLENRNIAVALLIIIGIRSLLISIPLSLFKGILFGEQKIYLINIIQIGSAIVYGLLSWVVLSQGLGLLWLGIVNCGTFFLENLCYVISVKISVPELSLSPKRVGRKYMKEALSFSVFSFITSIAGLVLLRTDSIIIQLTMSLSMVGLYAVAIKVTEYALVLTKQLVNVLTPLISELHAKKEDTVIRTLLVEVSRYILATGTILAFTVYVFGSDLLAYWVGEDFRSVANVLNVLITAFLISVPELVASNVLTMTGDQKFTAKIAVSSIVINIGVSLLLVKPLGLMGIAIGTLTSSFINNVLLVLYKAGSKYGVAWYTYLGRVYLPACIPGVVILGAGWYIRQYFPTTSLLDVIVKAIPGVVLYTVIFWFTGITRETRKVFIQKLVKRRTHG